MAENVADRGAGLRPVSARSVARDVELPTSSERRRSTHRLLTAASALLVALGLGLLAVSVLAPEAVDRAVGRAKVTVEKQLHQAFAPGTLPMIRLGDEGGILELDRCDGTFTEMTAYRRDGVPPLYAAHNNCGDDILLGWAIGQRVRVDGTDLVYRVVEERHTPKWSDIEKLVGISGERVLQTCYYGEDRMRFLGLDPE